MAAIASTITAITVEKIAGDRTHHQDQSIKFVNFSPMNRTVNNPKKPIPDELLDESLISLTPKPHT